MEYTNEKIENLIKERDALIQKHNSEIRKYNSKIREEIEKEKARYHFDWKRFLLMVGAVLVMFAAFELNKRIFPKTSIWSWEYYMDNNNK